MRQNILFKLLALFLLLPLLSVAKGTTYPYERNKEITYRYPIGPTTQLFITNSYGNVSIKPWEKDSIMVVVRIIARAKNPSETEKLLDYASIEEYSGPASVVMKTVFGKNASIIERSKLNLQEAVGDREVGVEYAVYAPSDIAATIENRFGDILLASWKGNLSLTLSYGDLRAGDSKGKISLKLKYGKAYLGDIEKLIFDGTYADLNANRIASLSTRSLSTRYTIEKCGSAQLSSKNDKHFFGSVESVHGTLFLSILNMEKLNGSANLSCKYGEVTAGLVNSRATGLNLKGNGTDFSFTFENEAAVSADMSLKSEKYTSYAPVFKVIRDDKVEKTRFLTVRKGSEARTRLTIDAISAYINLKIQ
ncbi:MAG: hypothetical protein V4616_12175 [Bacteroidota bacterium]